jgi:hypothetical protein
MNDLATLMGRPRRLDVGGRVYRVFPCTMKDLGCLQSFIDSKTTDSDDAVYENLDGWNEDQRRYLTGSGVAMLQRTRVLIGHPEADDLLGSVDGLTEILYLSIRRGRRRFTRRRAAELYWLLDPPAMRKVRWSIWGGDTGGAAADESDDDSDDVPYNPRKAGEVPYDWWSLFHRLCNEPYHFTPAAIGRMTWVQFLCAAGDGKSPGQPQKIDSAEAYAAMLKRRAEDPWA